MLSRSVMPSPAASRKRMMARPGSRGREKLAEFDELRPHALKIVDQLRRGRIRRRNGRALLVQRAVEIGNIDQVPPPIVDDEKRTSL
jgi:hypothetical protein